MRTLQIQEASLRQTIANNGEPLAQLEKELQLKLSNRLIVEADLLKAKGEISTIEEQLRNLEQSQISQRENNLAIRERLEKIRSERQGLQIRDTTYREQLADLNLEFAAVDENLPREVIISEKEQQLTLLTTKITKLGLINLAAIDEFAKLEERKKYLDEQNQDLVNALETLENAIGKIDADTRETFKEAYDTINQKFQEIFPKVFGGGRAYLEKTENNLLETGVAIMAEPPGKRNASIHLLSGGEKALTAISLIFAIFHLTPAPFCILDEVDAPLDDLNVGRFCSLVGEMAKSIQFMFITHNKLTMEMANQLIGVTMQEPGVSRIVAVDIDSAVSLADNKK